MGPSLAQAREAQPTVPAVSDLSRYCTACWRNARLPADSWSDCTQEVLCRLLQRVPTDKWARVLSEEGDERREFVRAIDAVKKRVQRRKKWSSPELDQLADRWENARRQRDDERTVVCQAAGKLLSERQQNILKLSFDGWTVQDIGKQLDLPPARVSDEKYKAIRTLRDHLTEDVG
jgi:RNA polymerase sigma factor (sigma-70 family)